INHDAAAALLDYTVGSRQAEPRAFAMFLGRKERLEDALLGLFIDAYSGIADGQHHVVAAGRIGMAFGIHGIESDVAGLDGQLAAARHGVARIDREIHYDLLDVRIVGPHGPELWIEVGLQGDVLSNQPAQHRPHVDYHRVYVENLHLEHLL